MLVKQKLNEAKLLASEQHKALMKHEKYTPHTLLSTDLRQLGDKLKDPLVHQIHLLLEEGQHEKCFLSLYRMALEGKLDKSQTFTELCQVFEDRLRQESSDNKHMKYGIRYPQNYLNFMILMRSRGGSSAQQYAILTAQLGGPSPRHLRYAQVGSQAISQTDFMVQQHCYIEHLLQNLRMHCTTLILFMRTWYEFSVLCDHWTSVVLLQWQVIAPKFMHT